MKYERALYFIYFGFCGNAERKCRREGNYYKVDKCCKTLISDLNKDSDFDKFVCSRAIDLIYCYVMKDYLDDNKAKSYPSPMNLLLSMTDKESFKELYRRKFSAIDQLQVFHEFVYKKSESEVLNKDFEVDADKQILGVHELSNIAKLVHSHGAIRDVEYSIETFISRFLSSFNKWLIVLECDFDEAYVDYPLCFYKAFALNLAACFDSYSENKSLKISASDFLNWHIYVLMPVLFRDDIEILKKTLLVFIDLFLCPALIGEETKKARVGYLNEVFDYTESESGWPFADRCKKRISNLTRKYRMVTQYFNRVPFSIFKNKPWFDALYKYAVKTNSEVEFITIVLSLLSREETDFSLVIDRANSAMTTELSRKLSTKDACQLNVSISRDVDDKFRGICRKHGKSIKEFIEDAIFNECKLYDKTSGDDENPRHSSKASADNGRKPRRPSPTYGLITDGDNEMKNRRREPAPWRVSLYDRKNKEK